MSHVRPYTPPDIRVEGIRFRKANVHDRIRRIGVIRCHALGDVLITLPIVAALRREFPGAELLYFSDPQHSELLRRFRFIDRVLEIRSRPPLASVFHALAVGHKTQADVVLDLQRSRISRAIRVSTRPQSWAEFDRFAPFHALTRYRDAAELLFDRPVDPVLPIPLDQSNEQREEVLTRFGIDPNRPLICLNPAGCWPTKNWAWERYAECANVLLERTNASIVLIGTDNVRQGAAHIKRAAGTDDGKNGRILNLVGNTSVVEAVELVRLLDMMISDDSGLMHMAWIQGVPTIGIFGSSRSIWSAPIGEQTRTRQNDRLDCVPCMMPMCQRGDLACLESVTVDEIVNLAMDLYEQYGTQSRLT